MSNVLFWFFRFKKKKKKLYLLIVDVEGIDGGYLVYDIDSGYCLM